MADEFAQTDFTGAGGLELRHYRGCFYWWRDGTYSEIGDSEIEAEIMGFLRKRDQKLAVPKLVTDISSNLKAAGFCHIPAATQVPVRLEGGRFRPAVNEIAFRNGSLDVEALLRGETDHSRIWLPLSPNLFALTGLPFPFDADAAHPQWTRFLSEVQPDSQLRDLLQEMAGYFLLPDTSMQRFFMLFGKGSNGKSVFCNVLAAMLGQRNVCAIPLARFGERFALWPITTCLLNCVAEMPSVDYQNASMSLAEDKLKAIVSGDAIEVERKNKDVVTAKPTARLLFALNELPTFRDRSNGVWRRMIIVPFDTVVSPDRADFDLSEKIIRSELPGVFNWALEGLVRLRQRGRFEEPAVSVQLKENHKKGCNHEEEFFEEHCSDGSANDFVPTEGLFLQYELFCSRWGYRPLSKNRFVQAMKSKFPGVTDHRSRADPAVWPGLADKEQPRGYLRLKFHPNGKIETTAPAAPTVGGSGS